MQFGRLSTSTFMEFLEIGQGSADPKLAQRDLWMNCYFGREAHASLPK
jgi:hypothetical protein